MPVRNQTQLVTNTRPHSGRWWLPASLLLLAFAGLGARLYQLQVVEHDTWRLRAGSNTERLFVMESRRGDIVDANGNPLTSCVPIKRLFANPRFIGPYAAETAQVLAPLLGTDAWTLAERLRPLVVRTNEAGQPITNAYVNLRTKVNGETWQQITQAMSQLTAHLVQRLGGRKLTPGERAHFLAMPQSAVYAMDDFDRGYTCGPLAAHVIGFAQDRELEFNRKTVFEIEGRDGIEAWFDSKLAGVRGWRQTETDRERQELLIYRDAYLEPRPGLNVELTLDMVIQNFVETALAEAVQKHTPESASCIVVRPRTGEILALATLPNYDPNRPGDVPMDNLRNRVIADVIEPGSTFKVVTISAALNEGIVSLDDTFDCENGQWLYLRRFLKDHGRYDRLTVKQILAKSSNIGAAKVALKLGEARFQEYVARFGFGEKTGITLGGEVRGDPLPPRRPDKLRITRAAIGQALSCTQLQMVMAVSALANRGVLMRPMLVKGLRDQYGDFVTRYEPQAVRRVVSERTVQLMLEAMKEAVGPDGTADLATLTYYTVAGKTGTGEIPGPGGYVPGDYVSAFIGFFPADQPEVCIAVTLVKPRNGYYGGRVAAPVFRQIGELVGQYLKLRPDKEPPAEVKPEPRVVQARG